MSLAVTKKKKSVIILAWIAPIVAIIISISMVYDHYTKSGNSIEIAFNNIDGLDVRQSHIQFNGLHIGDIHSIKIDDKNINQFIVKATIYSGYNYLIKEGSVFYKVEPQLSLNGVSDLSNVLKGNYIEIIPTTTNLEELKKLKNQFIFKGFDAKPLKNGIRFTLTSDSGDFDITSAILYKGLQIGEIIKKSIDKFSINYDVLIYEKYKYLISSNTQFYKINPLEFNASLENINIKIPSLKNMISSGIGFITPSEDENIKSTYPLYNSQDEVKVKNDFNQVYSFKFLSNSVSNNESIYYRGVLVGKVDRVELQKDINIAYGHIDKKYIYLINDSTVFFKQKAISSKISTEGLEVDISNFKELVLGGLTFITPNKKDKLKNKTFTYYEDIENYYNQDKFTISLRLKDNYNIKKSSKLLYKNIEIGQVTKITLNTDIFVTITIDKKYKYLFGKESKIYLQGIKISLDKIENISSTVFGDNLYLIADKNNGLKSNYRIDAVNPDDTFYEEGLRIKLKAKESKNITVGSPIYYKGFEVGEIYDADLTTNGQFVIFDLFIKKRYANIVQPTSKFYKATTIDMEVGVFGAKIKMGSAKSMLKGGIVFVNEQATATTTSLKEGTTFNLLEKKD